MSVPSEVPILVMITLDSFRDNQLPTAEIHSFIERKGLARKNIPFDLNIC